MALGLHKPSSSEVLQDRTARYLFILQVPLQSVSFKRLQKSTDRFTPRVEGLASRIMRPAHNQSRLFAAGAKSDEEIIEEEKGEGATATL